MFEIPKFATVDQLKVRRDEVKADIEALDTEFAGRSIKADTDAQERWDDLWAEHQALGERIEELEEREERVRELAKAPEHVEPEPKPERKDVNVIRTPENIYDLSGYRQRARSEEDERKGLRDGAMRSLDDAHLDGREKTHVARLLDNQDAKKGYLSRRILTTGSPAYRRAFWNMALGQQLTTEEARAMNSAQQVERAFTLGSTGMPVVYDLDPTVVPTSNFSVNPYRAISRVETISGTNEWRATTSGAITAAYSAEATQASDNTPTLAQPAIIVEKAQAFVQFSIEVDQDWAQLQTEMRTLLADAKDDLEATKFTLGAGHGSNEPKGIITAATSTTTLGGTGAFAIADLYTLLEALPPRFRPRASWLGNLFTFDKVRQFDTSGGSGVWYAPAGLQPRQGTPDAGAVSDAVSPAMILGRPAYESTAMASALTTGSKILVVGDFRYFVIVDRVGMNVEMVPLIVGTNHRPTGERGLYAYWRNSSDVLSAAAFRVGVTG